MIKKLQKQKEMKSAQIEKYLFSWIDNDSYNNKPYYMYMEYLWSMDKLDELKKVWTDWVNKYDAEYNEEFEGATDKEQKDNEDELSEIQSKAGVLLSDLYQKYARMLTKNKVIYDQSQSKDTNKTPKEEDDDETKDDQKLSEDAPSHDISNEEIEEYFSKSLEYNGKNVDGLQGFAAYYISVKEYMKALPFLQLAKSEHKWNANTWIQLARLCQTLKGMDIEDDNKEIRHPLEILKEGLAFIEKFEYKLLSKYQDNMMKILEELTEKLILYGGDDGENIKLAEKYCWQLLNKFDKLNIASLRNISKVCEDRNKVTKFFEDLLKENPNYCPALVEYAQFLTTSKEDRVKMLAKAEKLLDKAIKITDGDKNEENVLNMAYRCVALYMKGFVKLHQIEKNKGMTELNMKLNNEARELFIEAVKADQNNIYARINLAQFLAFKDNKNDEALSHLEYAYNNVNKDDPNLIANLIKVLAKKAIENVDEEENEEDIDMDLLKRGFKLIGNALRKYKGHFGLIVARSSLQNIKKKFMLLDPELDDGLDDEEIEKQQQLQPQTTYGMVGVDIMNMKSIKKQTENDDQ